jgi:hypothetical protein
MLDCQPQKVSDSYKARYPWHCFRRDLVDETPSVELGEVVADQLIDCLGRPGYSISLPDADTQAAKSCSVALLKPLEFFADGGLKPQLYRGGLLAAPPVLSRLFYRCFGQGSEQYTIRLLELFVFSRGDEIGVVDSAIPLAQDGGPPVVPAFSPGGF